MKPLRVGITGPQCKHGETNGRVTESPESQSTLPVLTERSAPWLLRRDLICRLSIWERQ